MILCARTSPWSLLKVKRFLTLDKFYNHEPAKDNIIEEAVLIIVDLPQIVHQLKILQDDEKFHFVFSRSPARNVLESPEGLVVQSLLLVSLC